MLNPVRAKENGIFKPDEGRCKLAIVIVTRNRCDSLLRTLTILNSLEKNYLIVVVDNASEDATVESVRANFPTVRLITLQSNRGAVARNYGVQAVEQPYVAFSDDDSWWAFGALSRAIELFDRHPRLGLIMSKILVGPEERYDPCCQTMEKSPLPDPLNLPGIPILGFIACGAIVRRSAFLAVNGFNQKFGSGGEEALLALDLARDGWGLAYVPEIVSHHYPSKNRNATSVKVQGVRNTLWTYWMRRSTPNVLQQALDFFDKARTDRDVLVGVIKALLGIPWVLKQRDPLPPDLEEQLNLVEAQPGNC